MPSRLAPVLRTTVKLIVSLGLMAVALRGIDLAQLWQMLRGFDAGWMAGALAVYAAMVSVSVWRWQLLLQAQDVDVPARLLSQSFWVALFFNNFLPSNIGGDVIRIADTAGPAGSRTLAATVVLVDRLLGLVALFVVASVGASATTALGIPVPGAGWITLITTAALVTGVPVFLVPGLLSRLLAPVLAFGHPWVIERAAQFEEAFARFRARPAATAGAFGGALVVQATLVAFYVLAARSLGIPLPLTLAGVLIPVSLAVQMAPVSINGFGVREAVFVYFFRRFGFDSAPAVALSLIGTALIMGLSLVGGAIFVTRRGRTTS